MVSLDRCAEWTAEGSTFKDRVAGYRRALAEAGLDSDEGLVFGEFRPDLVYAQDREGEHENG
jgi:DNA-binding LacI/PurR family transcriptional regulator